MPKTDDKDLKYVFLDLETTGSNELMDIILEIGMVITDANMNELARWSTVLHDGGYLAEADEFVQEMHKASGLADELADGISLAQAQEMAVGLIRQYGEKDDFVLAGSGVSHFDRRFLQEDMPQFLKWFRYYSIDVGVMRRVLRLIGRDDLLLKGSDNKTHRALDDALLHLEELRHIKKALSSHD